MQRIGGKWLIATAIALAGAIGATPGMAKEATPKDGQETVSIGSFSGAFLAARIAEVDNDLDSAIEYYKRALSFDRDNLGLQQSVMLALISRGSFEEALPYAEKLKTVPEVERFSRLALAVSAIQKKDFGAAQNYLKLALESDLDRLITGLMSGWAMLGAGEAQEGLEQVRALEGPEWYALFKGFHEGLIAEQAGLTDEALKAYDETVKNAAAGSAAPDTYLRAVEAHARLLAREGRRDDALAVLDESEAFASNRPSIVALRAEIEAGAEIAPMVTSVRDGAAEVLYDMGSALNRGGGEAFVRLYLQYARALKPDLDGVLIQLGQVAEQQGHAEEAISFYERVPEASPLKRIAELQLGLNLADLERPDEAKAHLKALIDSDPSDMRAYLALGGVYASKEEYREAADLYDRALQRIDEPQRSDWNLFYQRGIAYERLKEWDKAEPNFRKALELYPDQPQVLNYLGYSWVDMGMNLEEGLDLIKKAVELRPNDGYIVDSLGWAHYRMGRYEEAVTELERAVTLKPDDPVLNDHLGDAYWRAGRKLEATFQWAHARDLKPDASVLVEVERKLTEGLPPETAPLKEEQKAEIPPIMLPDVPAPKPAAEPQPAMHTVRPGQSLWSIATDKLGNGERYREILELNPGLRGDPGNIRPGQELVLPPG
ncbi:tetratricopeptide repeat protein [Aquibium sp. LZ166]|uniref:Tetratricopeptide repeat protein n=1 Tax=Aquibium pacificus TaxID=3153579 RepID=A0ABV3SQ56_9HYPH